MSNERWEKGKRVFLETKGSASDPSSCAEHIGGVCAALTGAERIVPLYSQAHRVKAERHVQK